MSEDHALPPEASRQPQEQQAISASPTQQTAQEITQRIRGLFMRKATVQAGVLGKLFE